MKRIIPTWILAACGLCCQAQNPFVQTWCTSDPAPMVHDGTMYVYTGHDEDGADFFWMQEWRVYSTQDMVNWTDHGSPLALESFSWADDRAWASQCIERNGKFYWYICAHSKLSNGMAIGVAVGDTPVGPFHDALGKPLFENGSWDHIDPTVMIDDDGQAWLMWGNPQCYYLRLNEDMISYSGELGLLDMTEEAFGGPIMSKREKGKSTRTATWRDRGSPSGTAPTSCCMPPVVSRSISPIVRHPLLPALGNMRERSCHSAIPSRLPTTVVLPTTKVTAISSTIPGNCPTAVVSDAVLPSRSSSIMRTAVFPPSCRRMKG